MPLIPRAITEFASRLLPGTTQGEGTELSTLNASSDPSHAGTGPGVGERGPLGESTTGKRLRDVLAGEERSRKRQRVTEQERLYLGDYRTPSDATLIHVPTYDGNSSEGERRRTGDMKGLFRPLDTLNDQRHVANKGFAGNRSTPRTLNTTASAGKNVVSKRTYPSSGLGDGFSVDNGRASKRQKAVHGQQRARMVGESVDLTTTDEDPHISDDVLLNPSNVVRLDNASAPPSGLRKIRVPLANPPTSIAKDYFENTSFHEVNNRLSQPKVCPRKRKASASQSSQAASIEVHSSSGGKSKGTREAPVEVADDSQTTKKSMSPVMRRREIERYNTTSLQRPPINLDKDLSPRPKSGVKPGSEEDIVQSGNMLLPSKSKMVGVGGVEVRKPTQSLKRTRPLASPDMNVATRPVDDTSARATSPRLKQMFNRDTDDAVPVQRITAQQRMLAKSKRISPVVKTSSIDDSFNSPDPLQEERIAGAQAVQRVPCPRVESSEVEQHSEPDASFERARSPSELQRSKLNPGSKTGLDDRTAQPKTHSPGTEVHESDAVPIKAFYSSSCILTSGDIAIVYDPRDQLFYLTLDGENKMVVGKQQAIHLGEQEIRDLSYCKGNHRVYIRGSCTDISSGRICIAFCDYDDVQWFMDIAGQITRDHIKIAHWPASQLDKVFANQASELQKAYDKKLARIPLSDSATLTGQRGHQSKRREAQGSEDELVPAEVQVPLQSLRKSMRSAEPLSSSDSRERTLSKYFADLNQGEGVRRSMRSPLAAKVHSPTPLPKWTQENDPKRWPHSLEYPSTGPKRVLVDFEDLERLDEGEFLNDNVISFALRQIEEKMDPKFKKDVHFFNTFFYTTLTNKNGKRTASINYDAVKRWTKNTDLFDTQYVVVPININLHWFVVIICNLPNLPRRAAGLDDIDHDDDEGPGAVGAKHNGMGPRQDGTMVVDETDGMRELSLADQSGHSSDRQGADVDQDDHERIIYDTHQDGEPKPAASTKPGVGGRKKKRKSTPIGPKYSADTPAIITLDSFGSSHTMEIRYLKDYIISAADDKRGMAVERSQVQGITAKGLPEQTNFCDCGVYLVGYVQEFAKNPRKFIEKVLSRRMDSEADFASFNPSQKRAEIRDELLRLSEIQEAERLSAKKRKTEQKAAAKTLVPPNATQGSTATTAADVSSTVIKPSLGPSEPQSSEERHVRMNNIASISNSIDDSAELEMEPARALVPPVVADARGTSGKESPALTDLTKSSTPSDKSSEDREEILEDDDEPPKTMQNHVPKVKPPHLKANQLSTYERIMRDGPPTSGIQPLSTSSQTAQHLQELEESDDGPEEIAATAEIDRPAEIPDSQEQQPRKSSASWKGTRKVFND